VDDTPFPLYQWGLRCRGEPGVRPRKKQTHTGFTPTNKTSRDAPWRVSKGENDMTKAKTDTATATSRTARRETPAELYKKFRASAIELGLDAKKKNIKDAVAQALELRKKAQVECPACGIRRRNPGFELCASCAREARAEDKRQAEDKAMTPSRRQSARLSKRLIRRQQYQAAHELYYLWESHQLPRGCEVLRVEPGLLEIKTPGTLFRLDLTKLRRDAPIVPFPVNTEEVDAAWEMTG